MDVRQTLIGMALSAMAALRLDRWTGPDLRGLGALLMFHHVRPWGGEAFAPNRGLEITPAFLDRVLTLVRDLGYAIIPMDEVPARLAADDPSRPFVALTFDDGYRDNLEHALPVLQQHRAPFTLYVTSGFAEATAPLWWLDLEEIVRRERPCGSAAQHMADFCALYHSLRAAPEAVLRGVIAARAAALGLAPLARTRALCLDWEGLATLARDPLCSIGVHTVTHPMLAKHPAETVRHELSACRAAIRDHLGITASHVAYPVGDPLSAGARDFAIARDLGFVTGVTTRPGVLFAPHADHLTALPRLSVNGYRQTDGAFRALLSGLPFHLYNAGRRLNVA